MQIIKEDLRHIILEQAEKEFLKNGFINSSLRTIAKSSGTTIGNLYHYFENKEAIFDTLVKNEYEAFLHLMNHRNDTDILPSNIRDLSASDWKTFFSDYLDTLMPIFTDEFLLLLNKSLGTKYENTRKTFTLVLVKHIEEHLAEFNVNLTPGFAGVAAEQLMVGLLYVIENYTDTAKKKSLICDMFVFFISGILHNAEC